MYSKIKVIKTATYLVREEVYEAQLKGNVNAFLEERDNPTGAKISEWGLLDDIERLAQDENLSIENIEITSVSEKDLKRIKLEKQIAKLQEELNNL